MGLSIDILLEGTIVGAEASALIESGNENTNQEYSQMTQILSQLSEVKKDTESEITSFKSAIKTAMNKHPELKSQLNNLETKIVSVEANSNKSFESFISKIKNKSITNPDAIAKDFSSYCETYESNIVNLKDEYNNLVPNDKIEKSSVLQGFSPDKIMKSIDNKTNKLTDKIKDELSGEITISSILLRVAGLAARYLVLYGLIRLLDNKESISNPLKINQVLKAGVRLVRKSSGLSFLKRAILFVLLAGFWLGIIRVGTKIVLYLIQVINNKFGKK